MRSAVILVIPAAVSLLVPSALADYGCSATDYAPESIPILAEPHSGARQVRSIARERTSSLVNIDAAVTGRVTWLKVRSGDRTGWVSARYLACVLPPDAAREAIAGEAARVLELLGSGKIGELATLVHPEKGVRFSPQANVDTGADKVLTAAQLKGAMESTQPRVWGRDDGSGRPIRLTFAQFYRKFIYDRAFAHAPRTIFNGVDKGTRQALEVYPGGICAAYEFPPDKRSPGAGLRLIFERHTGKWYLSGIIHSGWTI